MPETGLSHDCEGACSDSDKDIPPSSKDDPNQRINKIIQQKIPKGSIGNVELLSKAISLSQGRKNVT